MAEEKIERDDYSKEDHDEMTESVAAAEEKTRHDIYDVGAGSKDLNAIFENPLAQVEPEQLLRDVELFCQQHDLMDHADVIKKGALVARDPSRGLEVEGLTEEERDALVNEKAHK